MPVYATLGFSSPDAAQCPQPLVGPSGWTIHLANGALTIPNVSAPATGGSPLDVCPALLSAGTIAAQ